jgi:hypothetical protein
MSTACIFTNCSAKTTNAVTNGPLDLLFLTWRAQAFIQVIEPWRGRTNEQKKAAVLLAAFENSKIKT